MMSKEEKILKECNELFATMLNCHINGKPMADLLALYNKEKEKNKELEEKLKIATAMLTRGTYPEQNEGDNDFDNLFISKDKIKEIVDELEEQIAEFKEYVKDSEGLEKIYWKRNLAELVGARNSLKGLLEEK